MCGVETKGEERGFGETTGTDCSVRLGFPGMNKEVMKQSSQTSNYII